MSTETILTVGVLTSTRVLLCVTVVFDTRKLHLIRVLLENRLQRDIVQRHTTVKKNNSKENQQQDVPSSKASKSTSATETKIAPVIAYVCNSTLVSLNVGRASGEACHVERIRLYTCLGQSAGAFIRSPAMVALYTFALERPSHGMAPYAKTSHITTPNAHTSLLVVNVRSCSTSIALHRIATFIIAGPRHRTRVLSRRVIPKSPAMVPPHK